MLKFHSLSTPSFIPTLGFAMTFVGVLLSIINRELFFVRSKLYCFKVISIALIVSSQMEKDSIISSFEIP